MAGQTDNVVGFVEGVRRGRDLLEAIQTQKFDALCGVTGITDVRVVAAVALHLIIFQRDMRRIARAAIADMGFIGRIAQFTIPLRQRRIIGKGNRVVIGQIGTQTPRIP